MAGYCPAVLFTFFPFIVRMSFLPFYPFTFLPLKIFVLPIFFFLRIFAPEKIKNEYV